MSIWKISFFQISISCSHHCPQVFSFVIPLLRFQAIQLKLLALIQLTRAPDPINTWGSLTRASFSGASRNSHSFLPKIPSSSASKNTSLLSPHLRSLSDTFFPLSQVPGIHGDVSCPYSHFTHCPWVVLSISWFLLEAAGSQVLISSLARFLSIRLGVFGLGKTFAFTMSGANLILLSQHPLVFPPYPWIQED